jgi:hypothetical protein
VLILGEPGVGKTRLGRELLTRHADRTVVLSARAYPFGDTSAFGLRAEGFDGCPRRLPRRAAPQPRAPRAKTHTAGGRKCIPMAHVSALVDDYTIRRSRRACSIRSSRHWAPAVWKLASARSNALGAGACGRSARASRWCSGEAPPSSARER